MSPQAENSMMERLLLLPLFQGMAESDMLRIMEKLRFDFSKIPGGSTILLQDDPCHSLLFILQGEVQMETESPNGKYRFLEKIKIPAVLQPEMLFGSQTRYTHTFKATQDTNLLRVTKKELWTFLLGNEIFRLNYINMIAATAQNAMKTAWSEHGGSLEQRLIRFILHLCQKPAGEKILKIRMEDLAYELNETRLNVSKVLNSLEKKQLVCLKRSAIEIPHMEKLYQRL